MRARRRLAALWVALGAAVLVGTGAAPASAHAYLASSSPADGATLVSPPTVVELRFTEHVVLESTELTVTDTAGHRVAPTGLSLVESDEDREAPATVVATLPPLAVGAYHVAWRTLSSDDLHESSGILAFGVQSAVQAAGPVEASPDPLELVGRWAVLAGLAAGLGAVVVGRLLRALPAPRRGAPRDLLFRLAGRLVLAAVVAALVVALVDLARFGASAFTTGYAVRWGLREAALVAAGLGLLPRARAATDPRGRVVLVRGVVSVASLIVAGLLTVSLGHFGMRGGPTWLIASTAHLLAAAVWMGSVCGLALLGARAGRLGLGRDEVRRVLRRFRPLAVGAVVVVAVSGVYLASDVVASLDAALLTSYGRVLLLKLAAAGAVGLLALATTRAVHAAGPAAGRRLPVQAEAVGLVTVVALGGLLAAGQPAVAPQLVTREEPSVIDDRPVSDLQQTLVLRPNRPGASVAVLDVLDTRRPSPGPVTGVSIAVRGVAGRDAGPSVTPDPTPAGRVTRTRWAMGVDLPAAGPVDIDVVVHRRGLPDTRSTVRWVVGRSATDPGVVVSRAPLAGPLGWASAVLLALAAAAAAALLLRRRTRPRATVDDAHDEACDDAGDDAMADTGADADERVEAGAAGR